MAYPIQSIPDREILIDGQPYLYFGGTAYLGVQNHAPFKELYLKNVSKYGMHYGASRKSNVTMDIYGETERHLAHWVGSESCLTMSSGYLAAQLVVHHLLEQGHPVIAVPYAHTALLINGVKTTSSLDELFRCISTELDKSRMPVVLFDTIDFSGEQFPNFHGLRQLPLDKVILIGDDSHGIGVVGTNGNGCYGILKDLQPSKLLVCCSLGKALGVQGGAVFGDKEDIKMLEATPFYGGASPTSPAFMATLLEASDLYTERLGLLKKNYHLFKSLLKKPSFFEHMDGHPSFEFQSDKMTSALQKDGFVFTNFNYPNDTGPIVSRIVLSAYHTKDDIQRLVNSLDNQLKLLHY
nr:aminotransferase class I/II-fold pyridoxal phosphate-dependent enzyme [uncultured Allomuricauda sp.]